MPCKNKLFSSTTFHASYRFTDIDTRSSTWFIFLRRNGSWPLPPPTPNIHIFTRVPEKKLYYKQLDISLTLTGLGWLGAVCFFSKRSVELAAWQTQTVHHYRTQGDPDDLRGQTLMPDMDRGLKKNKSRNTSKMSSMWIITYRGGLSRVQINHRCGEVCWSTVLYICLTFCYK